MAKIFHPLLALIASGSWARRSDPRTGAQHVDHQPTHGSVLSIAGTGHPRGVDLGRSQWSGRIAPRRARTNSRAVNVRQSSNPFDAISNVGVRCSEVGKRSRDGRSKSWWIATTTESGEAPEFIHLIVIGVVVDTTAPKTINVV